MTALILPAAQLWTEAVNYLCCFFMYVTEVWIIACDHPMSRVYVKHWDVKCLLVVLDAVLWAVQDSLEKCPLACGKPSLSHTVWKESWNDITENTTCERFFFLSVTPKKEKVITCTGPKDITSEYSLLPIKRGITVNKYWIGQQLSYMPVEMTTFLYLQE